MGPAQASPGWTSVYEAPATWNAPGFPLYQLKVNSSCFRVIRPKSNVCSALSKLCPQVSHYHLWAGGQCVTHCLIPSILHLP